MKSRFVYHLRNRIATRWHMSLICLFTLGGGVLVSKFLLWLELSHPALRYGIAACAGYALFFLAIALWVRITFGRARRDDPRDSSALNAVDVIDLPVRFPRGGSSAPTWSGKGGGFSGGGASDTWGTGIAAQAVPAPANASSAGGSGGGFDLDLGDSDGIGVVIVAVLAVVVILGGAFYVIYLGPEILLEAAFETLLVAGVFQRAKSVPAEGWAWVVFKKTWWAFVLILLIVLALGQVIKTNCPEARSLADYRALCAGKK